MGDLLFWRDSAKPSLSKFEVGDVRALRIACKPNKRTPFSFGRTCGETGKESLEAGKPGRNTRRLPVRGQGLFWVIAILSACLLYALYVYLRQPPPIIDRFGEYPGFSVILVDNGENDYAELRFVKPGTKFYAGDNLWIGGREIEVRPIENLENYFSKRLPAVRLSLGDKIRVFFDADVVYRGKFYYVTIPKIEFIIDNAKYECNAMLAAE